MEQGKSKNTRQLLMKKLHVLNIFPYEARFKNIDRSFEKEWSMNLW